MRFRSLSGLFDFFIDPPANKHQIADMHDSEIDRLVDAIMNVPTHFASTFAATLSAKLVIDETLDTSAQANLDTADKTLRWSLGTVGTVSSITSVASMTQALSTGTATLDLTALTFRGTAVDFSALKVKALALYNPSTHVITLAEGASNGNSLLGTSFSLSLQAGDYFAGLLTASQTVGGTDKTVDLTGTGTDTIKLLLGAG